MKAFLRIAQVLLAVFLFSFAAKRQFPFKEEKKLLSIENAIKEGIISVQIYGKGGHEGECIEMDIKSLIDKDTIVRIEPGRRLISDDSLLQDILIVKEIQLFLASREKKQINIFGFCCQATNAGPGKGDAFNIGFMEDSTFILLAEYLGKSNLPLGVMQSAVWVLSNNHSLSSIHNDNESDREKMKELYGLIAGIKKLELKFPWYTLKYEQDTTRLFSNRPNKLFAEIEYGIPNPSNVDMLIRDINGHFVTNIFTNRPHHPDKYTYRFNLNVAKWSKGKYLLMLYIDNQMKMRKEFEL